MVGIPELIKMRSAKRRTKQGGNTAITVLRKGTVFVFLGEKNE